MPPLFLGFAQMVERIAAAVAHGDARFLGPLVDLFDQLFAPVLGQLRQHQANDLAVVGRIDAEVRLLNRLFDRRRACRGPRAGR